MLIQSSNASQPLLDLFARYPGVRLANADDSIALAQFINETAMTAGNLNIGFTRGNDFFALLKLQSEKYGALICEEQGNIVGVGAFTLRSSSIRGQKRPVGYFQDLRVSTSASQRTRQNFYNLFAEFVKLSPTLSDFDHCSLFLTAILDGNFPAKAALSRQAFPLEYSRLMHYTAHIWPKIPGIHRMLGQPPPIQDSAFTELLAFYDTLLGRFAYDLTTEDILRLKDHSYPVVIKENDKIVAACLLVQTNSERQLHAEFGKFNLKINSSGTYITALRVTKDVGVERLLSVKKRLITKTLRESARLPGLFTGFIETENDPLQLNLLQGLVDYRVSGSLYRVFHPDHTSLPDFAKGFLRPSHIPSFEWVLS